MSPLFLSVLVVLGVSVSAQFDTGFNRFDRFGRRCQTTSIGDTCPGYQVCLAGTCRDARGNFERCSMGGTCENSFTHTCRKGYCVPTLGTCRLDRDCGIRQRCNLGTCVADTTRECRSERDCGFGSQCVGGRCYSDSTQCMRDVDCGPNQRCRGGTCLADTHCNQDNDCGFGQYCRFGTCMESNIGGPMIPGGMGGRCRRTRDCELYERCFNGYCMPGQNQGSSYCDLYRGRNCQLGYQCLNNRCVPMGTETHQEYCRSSRQCESGYRCVRGRCTPRRL